LGRGESRRLISGRQGDEARETDTLNVTGKKKAAPYATETALIL